MRNYGTRKTVLYKYIHKINRSPDNKVIALRFVSVVVTIVKNNRKKGREKERNGENAYL